MLRLYLIFTGCLLVSCVLAPEVYAQTPTPEPNAWPMSGANPERTSWSPEEVTGALHPVWYRPLEPYIPPLVQAVAANNLIYITTASGLYALNADTGSLSWTFGTELPLGNSPTIQNGVAYVGGFDHKLYALNALTGQLLWSFTGAQAGYETNPLVANNLVYLGNRDGYLYAVHSNEDPNRGQLAWKFNAGSPIHFSVAADSGNTTLYFATDDAYAYAVNALTGVQTWKTTQIPGAGFRSWWPVVYQNKVIFVGSSPYRTAPPGGAGDTNFQRLDMKDYFTVTGYVTPPEIGSRNGIQLDATSLSRYLTAKPYRRTYFVIDAATGQETTYDFNHDGKAIFAPFSWYGPIAGSRYPPIVAGRLPSGTDTRLIYQSNTYYTTGDVNTINRGQVVGWQIGTPFITTPRSGTNVSALLTTNASDEPLAYASGGNVIYWNLCCDREAGAFTVDGTNSWSYWNYNLDSLAPGYAAVYYGNAEAGLTKVYGDSNGVYGESGDNNAPIPYKGKVYVIRSNAVIALGTGGGSGDHSIIPKPTTLQPANLTPTAAELKQILSTEVAKMISAGHLLPGFGFSGNADFQLNKNVGDRLMDYWHNTADTLIVLSSALPYLGTTQQTQVKTYLQSELTTYPPYTYAHNGWNQGTARESLTLPPEITSAMSSTGPTDWIEFSDWTWPPYIFYGLWKYALAENLTTAQAVTLFNASKSRLQSPNSAAFTTYPYLQNAWIAGYKGYVELAKLAGNTAEANSKQATLDQLLSSRAANFVTNVASTTDTANDYNHILGVSNNFMFMTPELAQYLHDNALSKVQAAFTEYNRVAPYWFVTEFGATYSEGAIQHLYDLDALFNAKAYILKAPQADLVKYIDIPAFTRGDLFYISSLVATLQAQTSGTPPLPGDFNGDGVVDYRDWFTFLPSFGTGNSSFKLVGTGLVNIFDLNKLVGLLFK